MSLAEKIACLRKRNSLSQEELSQRLSISRQAVSKWEAAESVPDIANLVRLSALFGVSVDFMVKDSCGISEIDSENNISVERNFSIIKTKTVSRTNFFDSAEIREFLCRAKRATYAGKGSEVQPCRKNSHDLFYSEDLGADFGRLEYYDTYLGGKNFTGEEALWKDGIPFWAMNYCGRVLDESFSGDFLKSALHAVEPELPFRGPEFFRDGDKTYVCKVCGGFDWFSGSEAIFHGARKVYECVFHGGIVR